MVKMLSNNVGMLMLVMLMICQTSVADEDGPAIAMLCGKNILHKQLGDVEWVTDPEGNSNCLDDPSDILAYCKKIYPSLNISQVERFDGATKVGPWCLLSHKGPTCKGHSHFVQPWHCVQQHEDDETMAEYADFFGALEPKEIDYKKLLPYDPQIAADLQPPKVKVKLSSSYNSYLTLKWVAVAIGVTSLVITVIVWILRKRNSTPHVELVNESVEDLTYNDRRLLEMELNRHESQMHEDQ